jgi:carboxyl-terminal processing protease
LEIRDTVHRTAWSAVGAAIILASALALSVPQAVAQATSGSSGAQGASTDADARRYIGELGDTFRFVLQNYVDQPDAKKLYEGAMKGLFEALGDPYSVFLDENLLSDMTDITSGQFGGVGLYISKQAVDPKKPADDPRYIEIVSPIEDTPGAKYGLLPGDLILKIDGESTAPYSSFEAQQKIRGEAGSTVVLSIRRGEAEFDARLVRAVIEIPTVKSALIPTQTGNIAYLRIIEFTAQTKAAFDDAIRGFNKEGYRALILDVRNDGGGLLQAVIQVSDALLDSGIIVSTKGRNPFENSVNRAKGDLSVPKDKPVVLLINKGSASASEILAGALKDNKRAYLVGENSYGKGSVQQIYPIDKTGYKMTTARYYTPSDENIDKTGIPPDLEVKDPVLSDAQAADLGKLYDSGRLEAFVKAHPEASVAERNAFAAELSRDFALPERVLRILVKNQLERTKIAPVYDLEFDSALNAAIKLIDDPSYPRLLAEAKSVKELVEAKKATDAKAQAAAKAAPGAQAGGQAALPAPEPKK